MSREVNISLRTFLEDLPGEVEQLMKPVIAHLRDNADALEDATSRLGTEGEVGYCLVDLDKIRRDLYSLDNRIGDCMNILRGYQEHITNPPAVENEAAEKDPPPQVVTDER
tara:strand:+ start:118 stop:450 length:333 start_codon:yes stop_codon:yes gene_type:complete